MRRVDGREAAQAVSGVEQVEVTIPLGREVVPWPEGSRYLGFIFAIFVITIAAAEVGLALAIVLRLYRNKASVNVDEVNLMKW